MSLSLFREREPFGASMLAPELPLTGDWTQAAEALRMREVFNATTIYQFDLHELAIAADRLWRDRFLRISLMNISRIVSS